MGIPLWPDGTPILGVEVWGEEGSHGYNLALDFDYRPPESPSEESNPAQLADVAELYGFLPNDPSAICQSDLTNIDVCLLFSSLQIEALGFPEYLQRDLILALACVCFRDELLFALAFTYDDEVKDKAAMDRFNEALSSVIAEIQKTHL